MVAYDLWVTQRCAVEDLDLDPWPDPDGVEGVAHEGVRKFRERREVDPEPANQYVDGLKDRRCYSFHDGRERGVTWYDRDNAVVFLLAYGRHTSGDRDDFYPHVIDLAARGVLYPSPRGPEYHQLTIWRAERMLRHAYTTDGPACIRRAIANPGSIVSLSLADAVAHVIATRINGGWQLHLKLDPIPDRPTLIPPRAALLAHAVLGQLAASVEFSTDFYWEGDIVPYGCWVFDGVVYDETLG